MMRKNWKLKITLFPVRTLSNHFLKQIDMEKENKFCQSCGIPLAKAPAKGTNADGSLNDNYCSYCYQNGVFTVEYTVKEFQEHCRQKMIEGGHNKFLAWLYTRGMRRLGRWKNN